jgi:WD40 repeat protein
LIVDDGKYRICLGEADAFAAARHRGECQAVNPLREREMGFLDTVKESLSKLEKKHYYMIGGAVAAVVIIIVVLALLSGLPADRFGSYSHYGAVVRFVFDRNGSRVASSDSSSWAKVMVWDVEGRKRIAQTAAESVRAEMMAFSADGKTLITAGYDEQVRFWEADTGKELPKSSVPLSAVSTLSGDGQWLIYSKDPKTFVWDSSRPTEDPHEFDGAAFRARSMAFSPDSKLFAMGDKAGLLFVYEPEKKNRKVPKQAHETTISCVVFSPDGKIIATASHDKTTKLWNPDTEELSTLKGHEDAVETVAIGRDGKIVLTGSRDGTARLWNGETGKEMFKFANYEGRPESRIALSDDGSLAVIETPGSGIEVYDTKSNTMLYKIDAPVAAFAFPPGKNILFLGGTNGKVYTWQK